MEKRHEEKWVYHLQGESSPLLSYPILCYLCCFLLYCLVLTFLRCAFFFFYTYFLILFLCFPMFRPHIEGRAVITIRYFIRPWLGDSIKECVNYKKAIIYPTRNEKLVLAPKGCESKLCNFSLAAKHHWIISMNG